MKSALKFSVSSCVLWISYTGECDIHLTYINSENEYMEYVQASIYCVKNCTSGLLPLRVNIGLKNKSG